MILGKCARLCGWKFEILEFNTIIVVSVLCVISGVKGKFMLIVGRVMHLGTLSSYT